jgi:hypothetical protein
MHAKQQQIMASGDTKSDFWEEQYHDIFKNLQLYQKKFDKDLDSIEKKCRLLEKKAKEAEDTCNSMKACIKTLGDENKALQKAEEGYLKERTGLISCISQLEKTLSLNTLQCKRKEEENKRMKDSFGESLQRSRDGLSEKADMVHKLEGTVARLQEENQELKDTLSDIREQVDYKDIKIFNRFDELFAKYISSFSHDEESIRHRFQDKTTQASNHSFKMLLQACHGDVTKEVKSLTYLIPDVERMVEAILYHGIEIKACMYVRIIQLKYSSLFDGASDALAKTKDLTKYKIQFEKEGLNDARTTFVVALLNAMQSVPHNKNKTLQKHNIISHKVISVVDGDQDSEERGEEDKLQKRKKQKLNNAMSKSFGFD